MKFIFTYGTDSSQPYYGGWTEVEAENSRAAAAAFRAYHPDRHEGILNCSSVYSEDEFKKTEMFINDNFGYRCREIITIQRSTN